MIFTILYTRRNSNDAMQGKNRGRVPRINEGFRGETQRGYPAHFLENVNNCIIFTWAHYLFRFGAKFIDGNYDKLKIHANVVGNRRSHIFISYNFIHILAQL